MHDCMVTEAEDPNRCSEAAGDCGLPATAIVFFISYVLIGGFVMLNLVIAVILQNFAGIGTDEARAVTEAMMLRFRDEWQLYDPAASGNIPSCELPGFLCRVPAPLGFLDEADDGARVLPTRGQRLALLREMAIPDHDGYVNFQELLQALTHHVHAHETLPPDLPEVAKLSSMLLRAKKKCNIDALPPPLFSQDEVYAALLMQAAWRGRHVRINVSPLTRRGKVKICAAGGGGGRGNRLSRISGAIGAGLSRISGVFGGRKSSGMGSNSASRRSRGMTRGSGGASGPPSGRLTPIESSLGESFVLGESFTPGARHSTDRATPLTPGGCRSGGEAARHSTDVDMLAERAAPALTIENSGGFEPSTSRGPQSATLQRITSPREGEQNQLRSWCADSRCKTSAKDLLTSSTSMPSVIERDTAGAERGWSQPEQAPAQSDLPRR
jgi:hypothetical protein